MQAASDVKMFAKAYCARFRQAAINAICNAIKEMREKAIQGLMASIAAILKATKRDAARIKLRLVGQDSSSIKAEVFPSD